MKGERIGLNSSRQSMMMNDMAFPGSAINTVGFRLDFPDTTADETERAVRSVADRTVLLHFLYEEEEGEGFLKDMGEPTGTIVRGEAEDREEADLLWEKETVEALRPGGWKAEIRSLKTGGSSLFFLMHHVLMDGYTAMQLAQFILNELDGRETDITDINYGYDGCGEKEKSVTEEDRSFWIRYFDGCENEAAVMSGTAEGCDRKRSIRRLSDDLKERIDSFEKKHGIKDSALFGAALALYLSRATQKKDAVFLMPRLNRENKEELSEMSCRTMVVPVRVTVDDEDSFTALCRKSASQASLASAHKAYGIKNIMNDLHKTGIIGGRISEYALNCIHGGVLKSEKAFELKESMSGGMNNHLTLAVQRMPDCINLIYDHRIGIYDDEKLKYFHKAMLVILEQAVSEELMPRDMEIVGDHEILRLLDVRGRKIDIDEHASIPDIFRNAVERFSDRPAFYAGERSYTYAELDRVSNRVANALINKGIKQGEPVLYKLKRDHRLLPVVLGILKSGAAFIPLDPAYPKGRIEYIQNDSGAKCMIVCPETEEDDGFVHFDADELTGYPDDTDPALVIPQEQKAYSIYTSGTTGNPKGVLLSHRGIVNITHPENNPFNREVVRRGKGIVAIGSVCFDISLFEFFVPLFNGCFIELAPEEALTDPGALARLMLVHGANLIHCTPSRLSAYLKDREFANAMRQTDAILSAGEVLPGRLVTELKENYDVRIYNGYGPTECTIGATITEEGDNTSIGGPIANMGIMILDEKGRLLPFGAAGEICIYGKGVGLGYNKLPEETKKKFRYHYGKRLYHTGDIGRFMKDGRIEYGGRNDFQVKIRGLRIELSEIENRMIAYEGVNAAAVQVRKIYGRDNIVAFYTTENDAVIDSEDLKRYLKEHMTYYMVPDVIMQIDEIPLTPGGKLDGKKLEQIPVDYNIEYREPENEYQSIICEEFKKVLKLERVGISDNFFEIGGDSLHTAEIIAKISARIPGVTIKFEDIFRYPVPEALAQFLYKQKASLTEQENDKLDLPAYEEIDRLLAANDASLVTGPGSDRKLGTVLITGVTGFLGLHLLIELLKHPEDYEKIYCLIRPTQRLDPERRLKGVLNFFESAEYGELLGSRMFALSGDIAADGIFDEDPGISFDTVINCAADVSHFAYGDKLERTNTNGVRNLIKLCERNRALLVQISTISVGGLYEKGSAELKLYEKNLYIGQKIRNGYILSKYLAEYEALKAMSEGRCRVKIMRVGNLQGRLSDGEFQLNKNTNAFTRRLASYVKIRCVSESIYASSVDFSPVDEVAAMIEALSRTDAGYTVFHVTPPKEIPMKRLFEALAYNGHEVEVLPDADFEKKISRLLENSRGREITEGILNESPDLKYYFAGYDRSFTDACMEALGLEWGEITPAYLNKYLKVLDEFGLFEGGI